MLACCMLHVACCMLHASWMFSVVTPFFFARRMLHVVCRKLHVAWCMLHGARRMLHASGMLSVTPVILFLHVALQILDACNMRRAACDMRHATCKHATINMRRATCDMQQATRSPSPFTCSHANMPTCNMRQGDASDNSISDRNMQGCLGELSGGGSEWAACTLRSGDGIIEELTQRQAVAGHG